MWYRIRSTCTSDVLAMDNGSKYSKCDKIFFLLINNFKDKEIKICWKPAYVDIEFNELVNVSAKEAAVTGTDVQFSLPIGDPKTMWRENFGYGLTQGNYKRKYFLSTFL